MRSEHGQRLVHCPTTPVRLREEALMRAREGEERGGALLRVRGLQVVYGGVTAVEDLSLAVEAGQAVAILGANGAGKSSTLRTIAGLQRPRAGEIWFAGVRARTASRTSGT